MTTMEVTPIFGWGWIVGGATRAEVPLPFKVRIEATDGTTRTGSVVSVGHEFAGRRATLSQRHVEQIGTVNIQIEAGTFGDEESSGYGTVLAMPLADPA